MARCPELVARSWAATCRPNGSHRRQRAGPARGHHRENTLAEAGYEQVYDIDEIITRMQIAPLPPALLIGARHTTGIRNAGGQLDVTGLSDFVPFASRTFILETVNSAARSNLPRAPAACHRCQATSARTGDVEAGKARRILGRPGPPLASCVAGLILALSTVGGK